MSTDAPAVVTPGPLPDNPALLRQIIAQQQATIEELTHANEGLHHRLDLLLRRLYGPSAERIDPRQLLLFGLQMNAAPPEASPGAPAVDGPIADAATVASRGHGRRRLPSDLPRHRVEHPVPADELNCPCCGKERRKIGEEVSEQLDYTPASLFILQHVRPKMACPQCQEGVAIADKPVEGQVIDKGLPGPGLVAQVIVCKYQDHLPLCRLEGIFARHGVELARSTMCGWMAAAARLVEPFHELMVRRVRMSKVIHTDDTPVPVQDPGSGQTRTGRLWVYVGDPRNPYTVYDYTPTRSRDGPRDWLQGFRGYLQADAFGGYDGIYAGGQVMEVACWAHARRKFFDARTSDPPRSHQALARIRQLYDVEDRGKELSSQDRVALRQQEARPLLADLRLWLMSQQAQALPKSPMGQAISYALTNFDALTRYTDDGVLAIDNNAAERALRRAAIGRKNYIFFGSDAGGRTAAILYSLTATAQRHGLNPWSYLRDLLARIAATPLTQVEQFLPDRWKAASAQ
jgi:transposase